MSAGEPGGSPAIRLRGAAFGYGDVPIIRDVELGVGRGEAVAVLGSNGSGKTTLVRGVLGLAAVLGGAVEVLGSPVGHRRERGRVGYVPQRHTVSGAVPGAAPVPLHSMRAVNLWMIHIRYRRMKKRKRSRTLERGSRRSLLSRSHD